MEHLRPSPEVLAEEEREAWRRDVGTWSWQFWLHRQPSSLGDVCDALEEVNAAGGQEFEQAAINQLRIIARDLAVDYGDARAFWLTIDYESPEVVELHDNLPKVIDTADELLSREENSAALRAMIADFEAAVEESQAEMTAEERKYYDETPLGIVEMYLPPHHESVRQFGQMFGMDDV